MLKREEILETKRNKNLDDTIDFLIGMLAATYPSIIENSESGNNERFAMAEHMIRKFFASPVTQAADGGALGLFAQILDMSPTEIAEMAEQAREDLQELDIPEEEIAITAAFVWFVNASKQYGEYFEEFSYLIYAMSNATRGDEQLKRDGVNHLKKAAAKKPVLSLLTKLFHIA